MVYMYYYQHNYSALRQKEDTGKVITCWQRVANMWYDYKILLYSWGRDHNILPGSGGRKITKSTNRSPRGIYFNKVTIMWHFSLTYNLQPFNNPCL